VDQESSGDARSGSAARIPTPEQLAALSDEELEKVDVVLLNLAVAKQYPGLEDLNVAHYQWTVDKWANSVRKLLTKREHDFQLNPAGWRNDIRYFRISVLCHFMRHVLDIRYIEEQEREMKEAHARGEKSGVLYKDPREQFIHGVIDTRRGTCANIPVVFLALARRLGWPVSLACAESHILCRFDDGQILYNIDVAHMDDNGFWTPADELIVKEGRASTFAVRCGSDLRSITDREMLGKFVSCRARVLRDTEQWERADRDYSLARSLFPNNRWIYLQAMGVAIRLAERRFGPGERGDPVTWAQVVLDQYGDARPQFAPPPRWSRANATPMGGTYLSPVFATHPIKLVYTAGAAA
jgi:hypothetical protein